MKYGLIAERVGHSFSAEIHNKLFGYEYELKAVPREELASFMREKDFLAVNVTIPYKEAVIPYLDFVDETALQIGAVNTIVNRNGKLYGYNTDLGGLIALINKNGIELKDKKVLVLGSGGTSKTAFFASKQLGAREVFRVSRSGRDGCLTYETALNDRSDADVIINTTPSGMYPEIGVSAIDINAFPKLSAVVDVVYNPLRTKLVCDALEKGIKAVGGLYMLVAQAALAAERFVDKTASEERIYEIYNDIYKSKENIVLVGMPGCGKTAAARHIAEKVGIPMMDTDDMITEKIGMPPCDIISSQGESSFRDIESSVIKEVSAMQGCVISTGGGVVLRKENVSLLRENGRIYFIDRSLDEIHISDDRPLSSTRADLEKRYNERYDIYCASADVRIIPMDGAALNADIILEDFNENSCNKRSQS